jgi:hypothetical protein
MFVQAVEEFGEGGARHRPAMNEQKRLGARARTPVDQSDRNLSLLFRHRPARVVLTLRR